MEPEKQTGHEPNKPDAQMASPLTEPETKPGKSRVITWLLAYFAGNIGADRFYLGQIWTGILKLVSLGGLGIWSFVDLVRTAFGSRKDKHGRPLVGSAKERKVLKILTGIYIVIFIAVIIFYALVLIPKARNVPHTTDIRSLRNSLKLYETSISGTLPTQVTLGSSADEVRLCGNSCQNDGSVYQRLIAYNPKNISIRQYQAALQVSNKDDVYLVTDATCNSTQPGLGSSAVHNMAILYVQYTLFGSKQSCADVPSNKYVNVNDPPYCGTVPSPGMSTEAYQFITAKIEKNKTQANITKEMEAAGNNATAGIIDDQLLADSVFMSELQKIHFDSTTAADVNAFIVSVKEYDSLITQERVMIRNDAPIPTSLIQTLTTTNTKTDAALVATYKDLKLPEPVCKFESP